MIKISTLTCMPSNTSWNKETSWMRTLKNLRTLLILEKGRRILANTWNTFSVFNSCSNGSYCIHCNILQSYISSKHFFQITRYSHIQNPTNIKTTPTISSRCTLNKPNIHNEQQVNVWHWKCSRHWKPFLRNLTRFVRGQKEPPFETWVLVHNHLQFFFS